jgi:hypothetical protein
VNVLHQLTLLNVYIIPLIGQVAVELDESPRLKAQLHSVAAERDSLRYELQATVHKVLVNNCH